MYRQPARSGLMCAGASCPISPRTPHQGLWQFRRRPWGGVFAQSASSENSSTSNTKTGTFYFAVLVSKPVRQNKNLPIWQNSLLAKNSAQNPPRMLTCPATFKSTLRPHKTITHSRADRMATKRRTPFPEASEATDEMRACRTREGTHNNCWGS